MNWSKKARWLTLACRKTSHTHNVRDPPIEKGSEVGLAYPKGRFPSRFEIARVERRQKIRG